MDNNYALSTGVKYRDYHDTITSDEDLNNSMIDRVFDIPRQKSINAQPMARDFNKIDRYPYEIHYSNKIDHYTSQNLPTPEYLRMKHAQEYETLLEDPSTNQRTIENLKNKQFLETKMLTEQIRVNTASKYNELKRMKPDAPKIYQPPKMNIYNQASLLKGWSPNDRKITKEINDRQRQILSHKPTIDAHRHSFGNTMGTDINEAFS